MTDMTMRRGDRRELKLWASDAITSERLTLSDKRIWFTAKRLSSDTDLNAIIRKGTAGTGLTGIAITTETGVPTLVQPWLGGEVATVTLATADTTVLLVSTNLMWDAQLAATGQEPQTPEGWNGALNVLADVTQSA